jgi:ABC-2 type transport system permease protein/oleandomycin transport system permease protein
MSTITVTPTETAPTPRAATRGRALTDAITIAWRNLKGMTRTPQVIVFSTIQPVIFVLNFRYVFGGALSAALPPGVPYVDFLMPGIFVQTVAFGSTQIAIGMANDLNNGLIERFRSLPMARSAVLAGRTLSDLVRNSFVVLLMLAVGFAVGFRIHAGVLALVAGFLLLTLFAFSLSWLFATIGMAIPDPEAAQAATFPLMAVLVFASTAFVPARSMPGWLQAYASHQPVSDVADALRSLVLGGPTAGNVVIAVAWCVGIVAVFAPIAVLRYRRVA